MIETYIGFPDINDLGWPCIRAGLFCLGVGGLWVIVSVVREWWRGRDNRF